ncbi:MULTISPECIES: VOC family protein [unclassified Shewanella]|uniref:VOC family protein n=2 Tax=unclassified Shewanella TaxID=196818 RepID=UPI0021DAC5B2|nr:MULTISPECIES: VOC family protein [unclassified Shewanella]MCU8076891.1 VOC family protein [Shewanella sp. SM29]MCU8083844.1 VOC family protein [Shewanella sp. SM23]
MSNSIYQKITFHHVGIPITERLPDKTYNAGLKMHATGYFESPYAMEWMEFDKDSPLPEIIRTQPHIGYVVEDLQKAIKGRKVILEPTSPCNGVTVAFVLEGRDLVEFLQFDMPEEEVWPHPTKFLLECF